MSDNGSLIFLRRDISKKSKLFSETVESLLQGETIFFGLFTFVRELSDPKHRGSTFFSVFEWVAIFHVWCTSSNLRLIFVYDCRSVAGGNTSFFNNFSFWIPKRHRSYENAKMQCAIAIHFKKNFACYHCFVGSDSSKTMKT